MSRTLIVIAVLIGVAFFAVTGAWALVAPHSFFTTVATYPPYNRHLFHDVGALSLGLAAALALGLTGASGLLVGLGAASVGASVHAVAHWIDRSQGGRTSDPWLLTLFALMLVAAVAVAAQRDRALRA